MPRFKEIEQCWNYCSNPAVPLLLLEAMHDVNKGGGGGGEELVRVTCNDVKIVWMCPLLKIL